MNSHEKKLVFFTGFAHCLCHMYMILFPPLLPLIKRDFAGNYLALGLVSNISYFAFGFGALPSGYISDRLGSKKLLIIFLFGISLSSLFLGFSSSFVMFSLFLSLMGVFAGIYHPAGLSLISKEVFQRGRAMGFHGMMGNFGEAMTPLVAATIASAGGWRSAYIILSIPGILLGLTWVFFRVKSDQGNLLPTPETSIRPKFDNGFGLMPLVLIFSIAALNGFSYRGVITFLPILMSQHMKLELFGLASITVGGLMTTIPLLIGILGQYLGGYLADRPGIEKSYLIILLVSFPLLFLMGISSNLILLTSAIGFALFYFANQPVGNSILAKYTNHTYRGMAYGLFFFMGFGMGSFATSFSSYVADRFGVQMVFIGLSFFLLMGFLLSVVLTRVASEKGGIGALEMASGK